MSRICKVCEREKPEEEFPQIGGGRRRNYCKPCYNKKQKEYRDGPAGERVRANWRTASQRYQSNPKVQHKKRLRSHGITEEQYETMFDAQDGRCKICHENITLVIDHCHLSKKVRGLLCNSCNLGLGYFKDSVERLESAIKYLS